MPETSEQIVELIQSYTKLKAYFEQVQTQIDQRIAAKEAQVDQFLKEGIQHFGLSRDGGNTITWQAPDSRSYNLIIPAAPPSGGWTKVNDAGGKSVMALYQDPNNKADARLELSLEGAVSICASLFHNGDDTPRIYATATDEGNQNDLDIDQKRPAFIITQPGVKYCPIAAWAAFRVVCLKL
jgi:hypothetical protein